MRHARVLLTTAGRKSYLARQLGASRIAGCIVATDLDGGSPIRGLVDAFETVPPTADTKAFVEAIQRICLRYEIDCVLPQNDRDLLPLADARGAFEKGGIRVAGVDAATVEVVADKLRLSQWLTANGFEAPETWLDYPAHADEYAAFVEKARFGQGSEGLAFHDCPPASGPAPGNVVQRRIPGDEYNLDILRDAGGEVVAMSVKRKLTMEHGSTARAVSVRDDELEDLAVRLARALGVFGSIDVDLILGPDGPVVLDVNPRMGGGFPFTATYFPAYVDALLAVCTGATVPVRGADYEAGIEIHREYSFQ